MASVLTEPDHRKTDYVAPFEEAWTNARRWYHLPDSMKTAFRCVYLYGRIDGMAYVTDKKIERMAKTNSVRRHVKDSLRNMEGM